MISDFSLNEYLAQYTWIIPILFLDIIIPILKKEIFIKRDRKFKLDADTVAFIIVIIIGGLCLAYIVSGLAYVKVAISDAPIISFNKLFIVVFFICCGATFFVVYNIGKITDSVSIKVSTSPQEYKDLILSAEANAKTIWVIPKRIHVMFKTHEFIEYLAEKRFGEGSEYIQPYVDEHTSRQAALYQGLRHGTVIRELHNKNELISYIEKRRHYGVESIENTHIIAMLKEWKRVLENREYKYFVRITEENIPIKYEIIDRKTVVIHESVGNNSRDRLNALLISGSNSIVKVCNDFDEIWERVPTEYRNNNSVIDFINDVLLPMLETEG